ncbi:MAG: hypothetical protein WAU17_14560 [Nitrospirales bacterium]
MLTSLCDSDHQEIENKIWFLSDIIGVWWILVQKYQVDKKNYPFREADFRPIEESRS